MFEPSCTPWESVIGEMQYAGILVPAWELVIAQTLIMCRIRSMGLPLQKDVGFLRNSFHSDSLD
jgi:hypothetical protein